MARRGMYRRGRRPLAIPAGGVAAWAAGQAVRAGARAAARAVARAAANRGARAAAAGAAGGLGAGMLIGRKRKATAQIGRPKKRRRVVGSNTTLEFNRESTVYHGVRPALSLARLMKISQPVRILRFQAVNLMNAPGAVIPGRINVSNLDDGATTRAPIYFLNLTATNNQNTPFVLYRLGFGSAGNTFFTDVTGTGADGSTVVSSYTTEWQNSAGTGTDLNAGRRYRVPLWYDVRLLLYGAKTQPTEFDIMLVTFKEDYVDPLETTTSNSELTDRNAYYQSMAKSVMYNPILPESQINRLTRHMVIHKQQRVTIQASNNQYADATPESRLVNWFVRDGRVLDHQWTTTAHTTDNQIVDDSFNVTAPAEFHANPRPNARRWLIIRALNTTQVPLASENFNNTPSFDIVVRKKEMVASI